MIKYLKHALMGQPLNMKPGHDAIAAHKEKAQTAVKRAAEEAGQSPKSTAIADFPSRLNYAEHKYKDDPRFISVEELSDIRDDLAVCVAADSIAQNGMWKSFYYNKDGSLKEDCAYAEFYDMEQSMRSGMLMPRGYTPLPEYGQRHIKGNEAPEGFIDHQSSGLQSAAFINHDTKKVIIGFACLNEANATGIKEAYEAVGKNSLTQVEMATLEVQYAIANLKRHAETKDYDIVIAGQSLGGNVASGIGMEVLKQFDGVEIHSYDPPVLRVKPNSATHMDPSLHKTYVIEGSMISAEGSFTDRAGQLLGHVDKGASRVGTEIILPAAELPEGSLEWRIAERFRKANPMARYNEHTAGSLFDAASRAHITGQELRVNVHTIDLEAEQEREGAMVEMGARG